MYNLQNMMYMQNELGIIMDRSLFIENRFMFNSNQCIT